MIEFGHKRLVKWKINNKTGETLIEIPAQRITRGKLSAFHGTDRNRKLIVSLVGDDLVEIRPAGTRRARRMTAFDIWTHMVRSEALAAARIKAHAKRERRLERLARQRQARAERRLFASV
jgi:hypothetical protein